MSTRGRLLVISNRMADDRPPAGGLVFALHACLSARGGTWIGTAAETVETPAEHLRDSGGEAYRRLAFEITEEEHRAFYLGYANSVLWPLFHGRTDLMDQRPEDYEGYRRVNARLAAHIVEHLDPDDMLWVHDYHFLPLAAELRARGVANRIGFFLHIPFPAATTLPALTHGEDLLDWLGAFDLVGLQTQRDVAKCLDAMRSRPGNEILRAGQVRTGDRFTTIMSFPIGIDAEDFARAADGPCPHLGLHRNEKLVIGVDRLDYSKGLVNRFRGFGQFLDGLDDDDPRATLLQIAPPSRGDVTAYQRIREALERMAGSVNGTHAWLDWTPIRYICRPVGREALAPLFRRADAALVTPLADGMNLVAKEYVAAQDPEDPGVLILSTLAGAAEQLTEAVLVNPYDPDDIAAGLSAALTMPRDERVARHAALRETVFGEDIGWWTDRYLDALAGSAAPGINATDTMHPKLRSALRRCGLPSDTAPQPAPLSGAASDPTDLSGVS
ncbi:trehalose-6-phosphate synthase [Rhodobacterales bacterium HKCCE2091]|nr:trehalose-6-phosphate synthase [Rhodobacterales bacterium HKCCE2091]